MSIAVHNFFRSIILINQQAGYLLFLGDMTALPAITANLKKLDADALGKVIIEVLAESDIQELTKPDGVSVEWLINPKPGDINSPLVKALENTELSIGEFSAWIACEYNVMKKLRQYLKKEKGIERSHLYASSYWKKGSNEEQHKKFKQEDAKTAA
jgi:NADPH-dependent ferric siderophore reductase